jgi:tetratricopeptide (TPR) repeat protein
MMASTDLDRPGWQTAAAELEEGKRLYQQGDRNGAEALFKRIIHQSPDYEDAWLWLAYVATTDEQRLRLLREASLFVPESERLKQAREWALEQYRASGGQTPPEIEPVTAAPRPEAQTSRIKRKVKSERAPKLGDMAQEAGQGMRQGWDDARQWTSEAVAGAASKLHGASVYVVSVLGIAAIAFLLFIGVARANRPPITITPMVLPTLVVDATPTPTVASRVDQEWVKVDIAWTKADYDSAVRALETILALEPGNDRAQVQLAEALYERAQVDIDANQLEQAKADLDRAIKANASNADLQRTRNDLERYREGLAYYQGQQWQAAIDVLDVVHGRNPEFRDTPSLLADSHDRLGDLALEQQDWFEAEKQYAACLTFDANKQECLDGAAKTASIITPPTRVEVSLTTRICEIYENGEVIKSFMVCTGRPSSPTVPGRYTIQSKIEQDAYASKWDLVMPYWLGIYWAGGSENGFHAYPLRGGSQVLWRGALGTGCSFGCIVLDTADAEWLYNWAQMGTVVFVRE